ncbi:MAG: histidinol-phosphatase [Planctomycetota bacterium]
MYRVSLHGGHSGEFCEHARGTLRETLEAAVAFGFHTFGVTEHAPRIEERFVYDSERQKGYDVARLEQEFDAYATEVQRLSDEFADRIVVLRGFEAEVVPDTRYVELMQGYRERYAFEYMVGSVHYVQGTTIDGDKDVFATLAAKLGGFESLTIAYYEAVTQMVCALTPEVVGHLDLVRKNTPHGVALDTPGIRAAAGDALAAIRDANAILDVNTAAYRKGLATPYPEPWLLRAAHDLGIPCCFGSDSHGPDEVGAGIEEARSYLLANGVPEITGLTRGDDGAICRRAYAL